ncbi:MAG: NlpC/P60 family protein [Thermoleophilia bacterium]|nr:NlpC/P60 family protein [Thermoleophilia bacterium]
MRHPKDAAMTRRALIGTRMRRTRMRCVLLALGLGLATVVWSASTSAAQAAIPTMTRAEIVARAETALGLTYTWGKESWIPNAGTGSGTDCSGLTLKCWEVPRTMLYQEEDGVNATIYPRYTSYEFYNCLGPWYALSSRSELKEGDILVYHSGSSGHVVIYAGGDPWNYPIVYEAPGTGYTIRRASRYLGSEYLPRRRSSILETTSLVLDNPTAKSVGGTDLDGNWARSTSNSGYYGDNYQVCAATTATAWARWTPRFPTSGYYHVYIRWTAASNRASSAKVTINTSSGQYVKYVDQRTNGGTWYYLGKYQFNAGYSTGSGSVTIWATGANGYVVADATKAISSLTAKRSESAPPAQCPRDVCSCTVPL